MSLETARRKAELGVVNEANKLVVLDEYLSGALVMQWADQDWLSLLASAPACLEVLAQCCLLASGLGRGTTVTFSDASKFNKGRDMLSAVLVDLTKVGSDAFLQAASSMSYINGASKNGYTTCINVFKALSTSSDSSISSFVRIELDSLKRTCTNCANEAKKMDTKFKDWLDFIMEIHAAVEQEEGITVNLFHKAKNEEEARKIDQQYQEELVAEQKKEVEETNKRVTDTYNTWKEALDKMPTTGELIGAHIGEVLLDTVGDMVRIGTQAYASKSNPMGPLGSFLGKDKDSTSDSTSGGSDGKKGGKSKSKKTLDNESDMSVAYVETVLRALQGLSSIVNGKDGVSWDLVTNSRLEGNSNKSDIHLGVVKVLLDTSKKQLTKFDKDKPSKNAKTLRNAVNKSLKVVDGVSTEGKKATDLTWKKPAESSDTVKTWRKDVKDALNSTQVISSKKKASTGTPRPALMNKAENTERKESNKKMSLTESLVQNSTARLESTLGAYEATMEIADKLKEKLAASNRNLLTVKNDIKRLSQQQVTLEAVRTVLVKAIACMSEMQKHVRNLVNFFVKVEAMVRSAVDTHLETFIKQAEANVGKLLQGFVKRALFEYALASCTSFEFFKQLSEIYGKVNTNYIVGGFNLIGELRATVGKEASELQGKLDQIETWSSDAQAGIKTLIENSINQSVRGLSARITTTRKALDTPLIPELPDGQKSAIKLGISQGREIPNTKIESGNAGVRLLAQPKSVQDNAAPLLADALDPKIQLANIQQRAREEQAAINSAKESPDDEASDSDSDDDGGDIFGRS